MHFKKIFDREWVGPVLIDTYIMSPSPLKIRSEALWTKRGSYFEAVIPGISRRFWLGGLPLISSTLPLLRPDDDRTGLVMASHNNCEHQYSSSRCWGLWTGFRFCLIFLFFSLYFFDGLPIFRTLLRPDDDRTSLVMVLHNNCNHSTNAQCVGSFVISFVFVFFDGVLIFLLIVVFHCKCCQHNQKDFSKGMLLKTFTGQVFCKRSCHLIWALSKYYSRNNADLLVIARGTELIPSFRCELRAHVVVDSADGKFRSTIDLTTPSPPLST